MKKQILFFAAVILSVSQLLSQESTFKLGDKVLNVGIGFGTGYYSGYYTSYTPSLSGSFEVGVKDGIIDKGSIGVGGYLGFSSAKYSNQFKTSNFLIGARGSFHYPFVNKLDTYSGLILGYNIYDTRYYDSYNGDFVGTSSTLALAWFIGARYYFNAKIAGMAEIGLGISNITLGVAFKL